MSKKHTKQSSVLIVENEAKTSFVGICIDSKVTYHGCGV